MAFDYQDIFGTNALNASTEPDNPKVQITKWSLLDTDFSGELPVGIGLSDPDIIPSAVQMLYGILMIVMQNQAQGEYEDPTQHVHILNDGRYVETGSREGQTRQSFTVSFYTETGIGDTPSIEQIESI